MPELARRVSDVAEPFALSILTTDLVPKTVMTEVVLSGGTVRITGICKGSGMILPNMGTMLGYMLTDAVLEIEFAQKLLIETTNISFNMISVDGDTSTNDCNFLMANGASGVAITAGNYETFADGLRAVCLRLALGIVRGGEGATKLITITVNGAATAKEARTAAKAIANSLLVKTAVHGGDPNWGRLIAVSGRAGVAFDLSKARVTIGPILLFADGRPHDENAPEAAHYLRNDDIAIAVDLGAGSASSTVWTCDLSAEYVKINAEYRT